jgi:hypothetical protein
MFQVKGMMEEEAGIVRRDNGTDEMPLDLV